MSLSAVRHLLPGAVAGVAAFVFSRVMIEPLTGAAIDYEGEREHAEAHLAGAHGHGHEHGELFSRAVQENLGAATGIVAFAVVMGVLYAVAYQVLQAVLERRGHRPDPVTTALLLAAGMGLAVTVLPALKYPANPPGVGVDDTVAERSSAFLTVTAVSALAAVVAVGVAVRWAREWGVWRAVGAAVGGYLAVMLVVFAAAPSFHEAPGPLHDAGGGLVFRGFPAELLADFRMYSLLNHVLLWLVIGVVFAALVSRTRSTDAEALGSEVAVA